MGNPYSVHCVMQMHCHTCTMHTWILDTLITLSNLPVLYYVATIQLFFV